MWMNTYLQDSLLREQMADAQRRAATRHLRRAVEPRPPKSSIWERVSRGFRHPAQSAAAPSFASVGAHAPRAR